MSTPFSTLVAYLEKQSWSFDADEDSKLVRWGIAGEHAHVHCIAGINEDDDLLQVFIVMPIRVPEEKRLEVAEFCARATYGMKIGRFETDLDDGEVRVHASAPFRTGDLPEEVVHQCVGISLLLGDHYFPDLMSVVFGDTDPDAAVANASARLQDREAMDDALAEVDEDEDEDSENEEEPPFR